MVTNKFENFMRALDTLCREHGVRISVELHKLIFIEDLKDESARHIVNGGYVENCLKGDA